MSKDYIKTDTQVVTASKSAIGYSANSLQIQDVNFNLQSNLSAVSNAGAACLSLCESISEIQKILLTDSENIAQMGEAFAAVDNSIAHLVTKSS